MLVQETIKTLIKFGDKTKAVIVTSKMTEEDLERLSMMLEKWKTNPTEENEKAIIDRFAVEQEDLLEPGINY